MTLLETAIAAATTDRFDPNVVQEVVRLRDQATGEEARMIGALLESQAALATDPEQLAVLSLLSTTAGRGDSLEDRLARLDARIKQAPGQLALELGSGAPGKPCGESFISSAFTCRKSAENRPKAAETAENRPNTVENGPKPAETTPTPAPAITLDGDGQPLFDGKPARKRLGEGVFGTTYLVDLPGGGQAVAKIDKLKNRSPWDSRMNPTDAERRSEREQMVQREVENQRYAHSIGAAAEVLGGVQQLADGRFGFMYRFEPGVPLMNRPMDTLAFERNPKAEAILVDDQNRARAYESIVRLARTVADGGIDHNDLNPSNVLVGPDGTIKLVDWALAFRTKDPDPLKVAEIEAWALDTLNQNTGVLGNFRRGDGRVKMGIGDFIKNDVRDSISSARRARTDYYEPILIAFEGPTGEAKEKASKEAQQLRRQGMGVREAGVKAGIYPALTAEQQAGEDAAAARHWSADHLRRMRRSIDQHLAAVTTTLRAN